MARSYSITYGSLTIDGSAGVHLHAGEGKRNPIRYSMRFDGGQVDITTVVTAATPALLSAAVASLIGLVRTPRQDLVIVLGGTTMLSAKPSDNTGFDLEGSATKVGDPWDNGCSQRVDLSWAFGLPADKAGLDGRRESEVTIEADAALRRVVTINGLYTAVSSKAATEKYADNAPAYCTVRLAAIDDDADFEFVRESKNYFETDKELRFTRIYRELLEPQLGDTGNPDHAEVAEQDFTLVVRRMGQDDSPDKDVSRMFEANANYSCVVPAGQDMDAAIVAIKEYVAARVIAAPELVGAIGSAKMSEDVNANKDTRKVLVTQTWQFAQAAEYIQFKRDEATQYNSGVILRKVWSATRWKRFKYFAPEDLSLTVTFTTLYLGSSSRQPLTTAPFPPLTSPPDGAQWEQVGPITQSRAEIKRGLDGNKMDLLQTTSTVHYEAAAAVLGILAK